ncbi:MAG: hypothetical protein ACRYFU_22795 [Janthinobacterium lividum]
MSNVVAISAAYCTIAHYCRHLANTSKDYSAREIMQMSMLAEYLHDTHKHGMEDHTAELLASPIFYPETRMHLEGVMDFAPAKSLCC